MFFRVDKSLKVPTTTSFISVSCCVGLCKSRWSIYHRTTSHVSVLMNYLAWATPACLHASMWQSLYHSLCSAITLLKLMRCAATCCQSAAVPEAAVEARLQDRCGWGEGHRKPSPNGKHTSLHRSNCSFYHSREWWQASRRCLASRSEAWFKNGSSAAPRFLVLVKGTIMSLIKQMHVLKGSWGGRRGRCVRDRRG